MDSPRRTSSGWTRQISLPTDEDGFFGRECPNRECLAYFKLNKEEYQAAREAHRLTCPVCGTTEADDHFFTQDQLARANAGMKQLAQGAVNQLFRDFARGGSRNLGHGVRIEYHAPPPHVPKPLPTYVERQTIRTFTCPNGGHRAVIYDLLAFCPYCGSDETPPRAVFDDTTAAMHRLLDLVEHQPAEAQSEIAALGGKTVLAERALTNLVAGLQNLAKQTHRQTGKPEAPGNPWQNVERLQKQWISDMGSDPLAGLGEDTVKTLRLAFGRRHVLEHNGGVADARYVKETGDGPVGRRLRITPTFVTQAFAAAEVLADRIAPRA